MLLCGFGIVFVLLRITAREVDLVPDSVGLALYAAGLWRLAWNSRGLVAASTMAGLAAVLAQSFFAPGWLEGTTEDTRDVTYGVAVSAALGLGAWGLRGRARAAGDGGVAGQLLVLAFAQLVAAVALVVGYLVNASDHDRAVGIIGSAGVVALVAMGWYAVLLVACASRPWARPGGTSDGVLDADQA